MGGRRIRLSDDAKRVFRLVAVGCEIPSGMDRVWFMGALYELEEVGLVRLAHVEGGAVEGAHLTDKGRSYYSANPSLRNPVDWGKVAAVIAALGVALSVAAICAVLISRIDN